MPRHPPCTLSNLAAPTGRRHSPGGNPKKTTPPAGRAEDKIASRNRPFAKKGARRGHAPGRKDPPPPGGGDSSYSRATAAEVITYVRTPPLPGYGGGFRRTLHLEPRIHLSKSFGQSFPPVFTGGNELLLKIESEAIEAALTISSPDCSGRGARQASPLRRF